MEQCPYCGETFKKGKLACPHCGSDAETGWKREESWEGVDIPETFDDEAYADVLAEAGLAPRTRSTRNAPPWAVLVAVLLVLSLSGLIWILF